MCGKLAPMVSGLINVGMGWRWTLWWCSIFSAVGFVYCLLFMEETNYDRKHFNNSSTTGADASTAPTSNTDMASNEKTITGEINPRDSEDREIGEVVWQRKTYWDKLGFKDKKRPNRLLPIMIAPFVGFTYIPVVYAGYVSLSLNNGLPRSKSLINVPG